MENSGRAWQWYGYAVCLIAVITGLICVARVIDHAFDLSNPLAGERFDGSLTSFEAYKATRERQPSPSDRRPAIDTTLRARYDALRTDRLAQRTFNAKKGLVTSLVLLLSTVVLFMTHWRWLRRMPKADTGGRAA